MEDPYHDYETEKLNTETQHQSLLGSIGPEIDKQEDPIHDQDPAKRSVTNILRLWASGHLYARGGVVSSFRTILQPSTEASQRRVATKGSIT